MDPQKVELSHASEEVLQKLGHALGTTSEEATLRVFLDEVLPNVALNPSTNDQPTHRLRNGAKVVNIQIAPSAQPAVTRTPDVMGCDACIRATRIPVWLLVEYKRQGLTDGQLLAQFPGLNVADLGVAWEYFASHADEVERDRRAHQED